MVAFPSHNIKKLSTKENKYNHAELVKEIRDLQEKEPHLSFRDVLKKVFKNIKTDFLELIPLSVRITPLSQDIVGGIHKTENYIRKRQFDPSECIEGTYRTFPIGKGKKATGCKRKSSGKFEVQTILEPRSESDFISTDFDISKPGRWITIAGKHIYLYKGMKPKLTDKGRIEQVPSKGKEKEKYKERKEKIKDIKKRHKRAKRYFSDLMKKKRKSEKKGKPLPFYFKEDIKFWSEEEERLWKKRLHLEAKQSLYRQSKDFTEDSESKERVLKKVEGIEKEEGQWITVKGRHIFIKKGQSIQEVLKETPKKGKKQKQLTLEETKEQRKTGLVKEKKRKKKEEKIKEIEKKLRILKLEKLIQLEKQFASMVGDFTEDSVFDEIINFYTNKGKSQEIAEKIAFRVLGKIKKAKKNGKKYDWRKDWGKTAEEFENLRGLREKYKIYKKYKKDLTPITVDARPITSTNPLGAGRPRHRGLRAGTTGAKVSGAKRTLEGQLLSKTFGPEIWQVGAVESVTMPYEIVNTETGITVQAELIDKLTPNVSKALTPVSSSNVRGIGTWNNELLIQFHPNKLTPMRTYRYNLKTPEAAQEAFQSLLTSGSPGRWVWRFIRGHNKGEKVTSGKKAPSLSPPGKGLPTIGGTSASLLPYKISNRTPTGRIAKFEELSRKLKKHITPGPFTDPSTGSRVEGYLGAVRGFRDLGLKRLDITVKPITKKIGICEDCKEKKELFYQKLCKECYLKRVEKYIQKYDFTYDFIELKNFEVIKQKNDFIEDFTYLHGPIVRDGPYDYIKNGHQVTVYKDYDNLKEIYSRYDVLPVKVAEIGAHYGEEIGFGYNFIPNEDTHQIEADIILLKDLENLKKNYHVSPGYQDQINGNTQLVLSIDHIALSLGDTEQSRACIGMNAFGQSCTLVSPVLINNDQNLEEVV